MMKFFTNRPLIIIDFSIFILITLIHYFSSYFIRQTDFDILFDFNIGKNCAEKSHIIFHIFCYKYKPYRRLLYNNYPKDCPLYDIGIGNKSYQNNAAFFIYLKFLLSIFFIFIIFLNIIIEIIRFGCCSNFEECIYWPLSFNWILNLSLMIFQFVSLIS